jgi:hypothetical protein
MLELFTQAGIQKGEQQWGTLLGFCLTILFLWVILELFAQKVKTKEKT